MKRAPLTITGVAVAAALGAVLAASALAAAPQKRTALPHAQHLSLAITGTGLSERVAPSLGNIAIAAGVPVKVTVTNFSREYHTFTIPGLHVSALIFPATASGPRTTTFTFTAFRSGAFRWHCAFCALGVEGEAHDMGGTVYVIVDPSALP